MAAVGTEPSIEGLSLSSRPENLGAAPRLKWVRPPRKITASPGGFHTPSTSASIPSRYQTFFYSTTEKRGFNSQATRFADHLNIQDNPGPGAYTTTQHDCLEKNIFSQKGMGGLASKNNRFARRRWEKIGPGSYNPQLQPPHQDFNKANTTGNFHQPIAIKREEKEKSPGPAPNTYKVNAIGTQRNHLITAEAVFNSRTPRESMKLYTAYTPSPNCYKVSEELLHPSTHTHKSVFLSKSGRHTHQSNQGPGPADYNPFGYKRKFKLPYYRQKHFLCFSAPALPLPPLPPPPGPGHYEITDKMAIGSEKEKLPVSGAVFKSITGRWVDLDSSREPGPADYDPRPITDLNRSFFYNVHGKWV